jgi:arabinose-5-phosphate isomerase
VDSARTTITLERDGLDAMLAALQDRLGAPFEAAVERLLRARAVVVTGMGKSGHIARKIAATFASTGTPSQFLHPAEASHGDLGIIQQGDVVLALSWSGESPELADIVAYTRRFAITLIAVTARPGSALGTACDIGLFLPVTQEACPNGVAPTTSTTMQLVLGDALAICLLERRGFTAEDFRRFHPGGRLGAQLTHVGDLMHTGAALPIVRQSATLAEAIVEMTGKSFGTTGVVDAQGKLIGIVTDGDLRRAFEHSTLQRNIDAIMTRSPFTVARGAVAATVLGDMNARRITSVFVIEDGLPVGLVHIHDLLRAGVA